MKIFTHTKSILIFFAILCITKVTNAQWSQLGIDIDGEATGDASGYSVSTSSDGTTVAIGAIYNNGNSQYVGHVRVYRYDGSAWVKLGNDIDGEAAYDISGISVSMSSDGATVAIGSRFNDGNGQNAGHVRVYQYNISANIWVKLGADIDGEAAEDNSGYSVSMSSDGTTVAIGAIFNNGNSQAAGHVRVYRYNGLAWVKIGNDIDGEAADDYSGYSVSMSSDGAIVAIGSPSNDGSGQNAGHVRVYRYNGLAWVKIGNDIDGEAADDNSGYSVSMSSDGTTVAIGAIFNNGNSQAAGHVRVYRYDGLAWVKIGNDIDGEAADDYSGYSLSMSSDGAIVAIGSPYNDHNGQNAGHVRVYQYNISANIWMQLGADIDGEATGDNSGNSLSMSSDGANVAIGSPYNDGNGQDAGHVRLYHYNGSTWMQVGSDISGEATGDKSGLSVSMSSDGTTVAIGAQFNDGNGLDAGHVRVYHFAPPTITSFTPSSGSPGTLVTITGTDLGSIPSAFTIGGTPAIVISNTSTSLVGMVMPGSSTGTISISNTAGTATSSGTFTVTATPYPSVQQGNKLVGIGAGGNMVQGTSVALSADGNTAIVGGINDNSNAGAAWVYTKIGNAWTQQGNKLVGTGAVGSAFQGSSVSLSADGNTAIVGGRNDNSGVGAAWVYTRSGSAWTQQGSKLVGTGAVGNSGQGRSVSLSADGNTAMVGGPDDNNNFGAVWVYTRNTSTGTWTQEDSKLIGTGNSGTFVQHGWSVALSADGNTAMVGGYNDNNGAGAAWVYTRSGSTWAQQGSKLIGTDAVGNAQQGFSVALSANGNTAMVGGNRDNNLAGAAWVYTRIGNTWTQQGSKLVGTGVVGTPDPDGGGLTGAAQGLSVSLSADGNTAMVGGSGDNSNAGATWVYTRSGSTWSQQGSKLVGTGAVGTYVQQGASVSLSADGKTAMVGGPWDNDGAGAAWVYVVANPAYPLITYDGNSNTGGSVPAAATGVNGATITLASNTGTLVRTGYTFAGWNTLANGSGTSYAAGASYTLSGNSTLYAKWITPTITSFTPSSGNPGTLVTITGTDLGSIPSAFTIGGVTAIVVSNTGTSLVGMVMPGSSTGTISISNTAGTVTSSGTFTVTATPYPSAQQGSKLVGSGNVGQGFQGYSVSLSADGNTAIVGGPSDNNSAGAAWVYARSGSTWTQQGLKLVGTGAVENAGQGSSVSLSADGNTAIVGGYTDNSYAGAAWVYTRSGGSWSQQGLKLVGTGATGVVGQGQGISVSLSADGNTAIVGGFVDNNDVGAVWIYTRSGGSWSQQGSKLVGTGATGAAKQGSSVSLSADGNTAIVGGSNDNNNVGAVWVFTRSGGAWSQQGDKLVGTVATGNARQGASVSLSADGNTAIVGGPSDNNSAGAVWVFTRSGGAWSQQGDKLVGTGAGVGTAFQGVSVALSADGNTAIVGGKGDNFYAGAAWVYARSGGTWTQQGSKLVSTDINRTLGHSVALSADGNTAMLGAVEDNAAKGAALVYVVANTVTYNGNSNTGGSVPAVTTGANGATVNLASNSGSLARTGYTFGGWNTLADGSGTSYAAGASYTLSGNVTLYTQWTLRPTPPGNALHFDGVNDNAITTTLALDNTDVPVTTWEAWVYPTTNDAEYRMIMGVEDNGCDRFVAINSGNFVVGIGTAACLWSPVAIDLNKWQHIAVMYNEGTGVAKFYKNGVEYTSSLSGHSAAVKFGIGCSQQAGPTQFFKGAIDDVRVWNVARTQTQIQNALYSELLGNEANLLAYYNFNQGTPSGSNSGVTTLNDITGNGHSATLSNFALTGSTSNWVESYAMVVPTSSAATSKTSSGFTANWTAPSIGTVTNYLLDVSTSSDFSSFVSGYNGLSVSGTSQAVTGLSAGTTCYYRVRADKTSVTGQGAYSSVQTVLFNIVTWTGAVSNLWNEAGNWSSGTVPVSSDIVIINTITPRAPQLNVDFTVGSSLTISGSGTLTVNAGKTLSVAAGGTADFGDKLVTFKSDATGSAQFGQMLGTLSNANNVTVERHIPASNRTFRFISSPVTTSTSIRYNWMENATLGVDSYPYAAGSAQNPNSGYGTHITGSGGNTNGFDQTGSNNPSLFTHDNSGAGAWNAVTTTAGPLAAGDAYRIQIRGDRGYAIFASPLPAQTATTLRTNGTLFTGDKPVSLNTTANGFSMIGNPYQATVDMYAAGITKTNITDYYYIWDPRMGTRGAYVSYGGSVTRISSNVASAVNQYLQPGQAVFVQTSSTAGPASITFAESAKSIASNQSLVFSRFKGNAGVEFGAEPNAPQTTYTSLSTTLYYTDSLAKGAMPMDGMKVLFDNTFSNVVDQVDAKKMYNLDETMSVLRDGTNLSIELMNKPDSTTVIPLNITQYRTQKYTFRMKWTNPYTGINNKVTAYLKDKYTGSQYEINNTLTTDIPYTIDAAVPTSFAADRFDIIFKPTALVVLPIAEIALTAAVQQNGIKLQWTNPYDKDLSKYEVERSADGRIFTKVNTQAGGNGIQKNIIYNWFDATPIEGYNYYRIKGLALNNGKTQWSNNLKIRSWTVNIGTTIVPNPAERTGLNIKTDLPKGYYDMKLIDSRGRVVYTKGVEYNGLGGAIELRYGVQLAAGTYYLHIEGMGERVVRGVVVR